LEHRRAYPHWPLGAGDVTLLFAYGGVWRGLRDSGIVHAPVFIRRVEDSDGKVLYVDRRQVTARNQRESTAFLMS
jgi:membrane peptidoglycan carboxypeptidase